MECNKLKLNLGSGTSRISGFLNIDKSPNVNPDICCDIEKGIPLEDNSVVEIKAKMILEHISDLIKVMNELYRIMENNAILDIEVPYETSVMAWGDPTHKRVFNEDSFGYFCSKWNGGYDKKSNHYRRHNEYGITCNFEMIHQKITNHRRHGKLSVKLISIK